MKALGEPLREHLESGVTTMCFCCRVTRSDGQVAGFTEHDEDLRFDGTTFLAASGFSASQVQQSLGLAADNLSVTGALSSASISEDDLAAGRYDDAYVELFWVNWKDPEQRLLQMAGYTGDPWPGAAAIYRDDDAGGFRRIQTVLAAATIGELASDLWSGPTNRWDRVNSFRVRLYSGGFVSVSEAQLLGGGEDNLIAVRNPATRLWEVLQFARATLVAPGVYELQQLLRGQLGTADAMGSPVPAGASLVVLEPGSVVPLNLDSELAATKLLYRWGPAQYPASDEAFIQARHQGTKRGLRPYAPCDVRLRRIAATDDLAIGWKRRARLKGDDWEREEVPLVEESEKYRLRLLWAGGAVARTVVLTAPSYTWTAAEQVADFGSLRRYVRLRIEQYGADYGGWGTPFEDTVYMGSAS